MLVWSVQVDKSANLLKETGMRVSSLAMSGGVFVVLVIGTQTFGTVGLTPIDDASQLKLNGGWPGVDMVCGSDGQPD